MDKIGFELKCYEAYKLEWMISHGYSMRDYLDALITQGEEAAANDEFPDSGFRDTLETLDNLFEYDSGLGSGTIWACKDEFLGAEFENEDYMLRLFSLMPNSKEMEDFWRVMYGHSKTINSEPALEVPTSAGILKAYPSTDPGQPGICVVLQPAGYNCEIDMSYVSVYENSDYATEQNERPVDVSIVTYSDVYTEDYTSKDIIRREDIVEALKGEEVSE